MAIKRGVSLYSYQKAYFCGQVDLEGMVRLAAQSAGATGIQLLPEQMPIGRYPNTYPRDVAWWKELMQKYGTEPVCLDSTFSTAVYKGRLATGEEQRQLIENELHYAASFGFRAIRYPLGNLHRRTVEESLGLAEEYGVSIGMEIHAPMTMDAPIVQKFLDMLARTGTKAASIIPDLAIYSRGVNAIVVDNYLRAGAREELVREVCAAYAAREGAQRILAMAQAWNASELERGFIRKAAFGTNDVVEHLRPYVQYISNVHGKCYWLDEGCTEPGIDTEAVVKLLQE